MTDLSNKPISYTGSHPLELAYRALLARAEAAEAEAERAAQQWRPVTEKPAEPGRYLVWCPSPWPGYEIAPYDRGWGYVDLRFTHWQPLPPAPDTQEPTL